MPTPATDYEVLKTYSSKTSSGSYEVRRDKAGKLYCTCPGWKFSEGTKTCKHLRDYGEGSGEEDDARAALKRKSASEEAKLSPEALREQREKLVADRKTLDDKRLARELAEQAKTEAEQAEREKREREESKKPFTPKLSFTVKKVDKGIIWPGTDEFFHVPKDHKDCLDVIEELAGDLPQNVILTGPQGCGKTELAIWYAAKYERPLIVMNCATIREPKDWFGYKDAKDGSVFWHKSDFVRAVTMGEAVVLLDEFNRLHSTLHNALYPLLDARRATFVEEIGEMVNVGKRTVFFATCNIGFNHTGTFQMDAAIEDRFSVRIESKFLPPEQEVEVIKSKTGIGLEDAKKLAKLAQNIRQKATGSGATLQRNVSTRQLLQTAVLMRRMKSRGLALHKALEFTVLPFYSDDGGKDSERAQVQQMIQGIFVTPPPTA
jgi:nitric oxide reductase NorQ protein